MISIVTGYYNRIDLFMNTLKSIEQSEIKDIEVIAVDDGSSEEHRLEGITERFPFLKVIRVEPKDKWWINPCVPFNMGFKEAKGDIVIIQNPECKHVGDVIKRVSEMGVNEYISFACYSLDEESTYGSQKNIQYINRGVTFDGQLGWYNHSRIRPVGYHFCAAIHKNRLDELGGFDERYANGVAYDDNEILVRIGRMGLNRMIVDEPFVLHQWHYNGNYQRPNNAELVGRNRDLLNNVTMKETTWTVNQK
tara:strand:- start:349 stop:1098 length:750 start_codon:yes stop_codon:yes gene_type:complete